MARTLVRADQARVGSDCLLVPLYLFILPCRHRREPRCGHRSVFSFIGRTKWCYPVSAYTTRIRMMEWIPGGPYDFRACCRTNECGAVCLVRVVWGDRVDAMTSCPCRSDAWRWQCHRPRDDSALDSLCALASTLVRSSITRCLALL